MEQGEAGFLGLPPVPDIVGQIVEIQARVRKHPETVRGKIADHQREGGSIIDLLSSDADARAYRANPVHTRCSPLQADQYLPQVAGNPVGSIDEAEIGLGRDISYPVQTGRDQGDGVGILSAGKQKSLHLFSWSSKTFSYPPGGISEASVPEHVSVFYPFFQNESKTTTVLLTLQKKMRKIFRAFAKQEVSVSFSIRVNPTVVVVGIFLALLFILTLYMIRDGFHERSLKRVSGRLGQTETALRNIDGKLHAALDVEKNLKNRLRTLEQQYTEDKRALTQELERERAASLALKQGMEGLKGRHAESLADERDRAKQSLAFAGEQHERELAELRTRTRSDLEQALAAAGEEYQEKLARIHQEARTALDDARRTSAELEEQLAAAVRKRGSLVEEIDALNAELQEANAMLADARRQIEAGQEGLREEYTEQLDQARNEITALNQHLFRQKSEADRTLADLNREHAELEARLKSELARSEQQLQQARQAYSKLERLHGQFAELHGQYTERGMRLTVSESELQFPGGQFSLPSTEIESLDRIAGFLEANKTLNILVEGHTDSGGSDGFNRILSRRRAEAVKQALVERGVEASRIEATGVGEARPVASNQTYYGRRRNRRVEIYIIED